MKASDIRERDVEALKELRDSLKKDLFGYRMKNHTSQLDDTSLLRKTKKDLARIELVLHERLLKTQSDKQTGGDA